MCGIAGILLSDADRFVDPKLVRDMCAALRHRGPDDAGEFIDGPVGLGHRRLSIIDLSGGHQPLKNENGRVVVVFNGEIYNFAALRARLEAQGHSFRTRSDTEVLVHLYEECGEDVARTLNGIFAFALWDADKQRLLLARDHTGVKPLYYVATPQSFAFASEIRALLQLPWVPRDIDREALDEFLRNGFVTAPRTIFRAVRKVQPGCTVSVDASGHREKRYFEIGGEQQISGTEEDLADRLLAELDRSVHMQMVSDVPVGAFVSGGLDSSAVLALMRRHATGKLQTFSVGIEDTPECDESQFATLVSRQFETEHHQIMLRGRDVPRLLQQSAAFIDEPIVDAATSPTFLLSKLAGAQLKVVLTGEGADETWAGYESFRKARWVDRYRKVPRLIRRVTDPMLRQLPVPSAQKLVDASHDAEYFGQGAIFDAELRGRLCHPDRRQNAQRCSHNGNGANGHAHLTGVQDSVHGLSRALMSHSLPERLLLKVDRMTMAHSLEARVPFLDIDLVRFAMSVPGSFKLRAGSTKYLLRRALSRVLPKEILVRPKHGFELPISKWLRTSLATMVMGLFAEPASAAFLNPTVSRELITRHLNGEDLGPQVWALMSLELWARENLHR